MKTPVRPPPLASFAALISGRHAFVWLISSFQVFCLALAVSADGGGLAAPDPCAQIKTCSECIDPAVTLNLVNDTSRVVCNWCRDNNVCFNNYDNLRTCERCTHQKAWCRTLTADIITVAVPVVVGIAILTVLSVLICRAKRKSQALPPEQQPASSSDGSVTQPLTASNAPDSDVGIGIGDRTAAAPPRLTSAATLRSAAPADNTTPYVRLQSGTDDSGSALERSVNLPGTSSLRGESESVGVPIIQRQPTDAGAHQGSLTSSLLAGRRFSQSSTSSSGSNRSITSGDSGVGRSGREGSFRITGGGHRSTMESGFMYSPTSQRGVPIHYIRGVAAAQRGGADARASQQGASRGSGVDLLLEEQQPRSLPRLSSTPEAPQSQ